MIKGDTREKDKKHHHPGQRIHEHHHARAETLHQVSIHAVCKHHPEQEEDLEYDIEKHEYAMEKEQRECKKEHG